MRVTLKLPITGSLVCIPYPHYTLEKELVGDCTFSFYYNGEEYTGSITHREEEGKLLLSFANEDVALPSMMCLDVLCGDCGVIEDEEGCVNNESLVITDETKLAILDEEGCPMGFVLFETLKKEIIDCVKKEDLWFDFCDLLPDDGIPQGSLVASDRILTTIGDGCSLKSIPQSDLCCPDGE